MKKLIFEKQGKNFPLYKLKNKNFEDRIIFLGDFLENEVSDKCFFLDWLTKSSPTREDETAGNAYRIYRIKDQIIITREWYYLEEAPENAKYTLPAEEMLKILQMWKMAVKDKNSPKYLTIEENNKHFTFHFSDEEPPELKEKE